MFVHKFLFLLFIIITTTHTNLLVLSSNSGPEINITKHVIFPDFSPNDPRTINQDITLLGSAAISPDGCIQIPENNLQSSAGRAIYSSPIRMLDPNTRLPTSFNTTFSFQFYNPSNFSTPPSGGMSFIIVPDEFTVGRPGPWLGMLNDACEDEYKVFALEFDTRMNPEFGDLNDNHIGINLGSIVSTTTINVSDFGLHLNDGKVHRAWIVYNGYKEFLEIFLGLDNGTIPKTIYSGNLDLSSYLNEYMFIGFSGSIGNNHTQVHKICCWNFTSVSRAFLRVPSMETCESKITVDQNGENFRNVPSKTPTSFFVFVAVVVLVVVIMINLYLNGKRKEKRSISDEIAMVSKEKQRPGPPNRARKYGLAEVSSATRGFGELQVLGSDSRSVTVDVELKFIALDSMIDKWLISGSTYQ